MSSSKEPGVKTLWFRTPSNDHHPSLHDWARFIMAKKAAVSSAESPLSPLFTLPFQAAPSRDRTDSVSRPNSSSRAVQHKSSTTTQSTVPPDRSITYGSESPSLRSRRSDISSPSSNNHPAQRVPEQHYTTVLPGDIVAPGHYGEFQGQFVERYASGHGRSPTVSSSIRAEDSISPSSQPLSPAVIDITSPPAPGETILDRAFQLGQIPGADAHIPGQENLSSIARFDALMRESEVKRRRRQMTLRGHQERPDRSDTPEATSDGHGSAGEGGEADGETDSETDHYFSHHHSPQSDDNNIAPLMSPSAQRALAFIASRGRGEPERGSKSHRPSVSRTHVSFQDGKLPPSRMSPPSPPSPSSHPHTSHAKTRPDGSPSQSSCDFIPTATNSADLLPSSYGRQAEAAQPSSTTVTAKRQSNSSDKRLSFTEFTKKLSSTSSSLLVQSNASAASSITGSETDMQNSPLTPRTNLTLRASCSSSPRPNERDDQEKRCRWRKTVGPGFS